MNVWSYRVRAFSIPILIRYRRFIIVFAHLGLFAFANYVAFALRFDGNIPAPFAIVWRQTVPWVTMIRALSLIPFRFYSGLWRYTGIPDLTNLCLGVAISEVAIFSAVKLLLPNLVYPRSVFVVDPLLLICMIAGLRLAPRVYFELRRVKPGRRILIYGAGDAAESLVRDMKKNASLGFVPIGFVDDNRATVGGRIHGLPVLGTGEELGQIITSQNPDEILIAIPSAGPQAIRKIISSLQPFKLPIKAVPNLRDIMDDRVSVQQIRDVSLVDLLPRSPVGLSRNTLVRLIAGKRVLVTGAGGSIGSELCRQIAKLKPERLVLVERYENNLYWIENELLTSFQGLDLVSIIGDVSDRVRIDDVFRRNSIQIVFHAAAHKHVPMMELHPCEAVKNNVIGTHTTLEAAERYGVEVFVFISTDKAVNPTSVMGATKKVAETIVRAVSAQSGRRFVIVRFGNVLGSNGSVVPRFMEQIRAGGPVTVTHPEMRRFFMLIPEAVELVLHAAAMNDTGNIYVLQMGEQVKILEMARNLIRLAGYIPGKEIPIQFTGLRPGEKLYEELVGKDESVETSDVAEIVRVKGSSPIDPNLLRQRLRELERVALRGDSQAVISLLQQLVPHFRCTVSATQTTAGERVVPMAGGVLFDSRFQGT
jgi:FlaA1/EpsC-like NDP-sugar epimerase